MRTTKLIFFLILAACLVPVLGSAAQGGGTRVRAVLVIASKEKGPTDPKAAPYVGELRANLRYESFRYVGENSTTVPAGGKASLEVQGRRLELQSEGGGVFARIPGGGGGPLPTVFNVGGADKGGVYFLVVQAN
jgi:hypothetical protein